MLSAGENLSPQCPPNAPVQEDFASQPKQGNQRAPTLAKALNKVCASTSGRVALWKSAWLPFHQRIGASSCSPKPLKLPNQHIGRLPVSSSWAPSGCRTHHPPPLPRLFGHPVVFRITLLTALPANEDRTEAPEAGMWSHRAGAVLSRRRKGPAQNSGVC